MVAAVERSFRILDLLGRSPAPLGTSEVARRLRLAKSTAHGLLRSLEEVEAIEKVRQGYRLGPGGGAAVPGGVVFVAGFADRLDGDRLSEVGELLQRLLAGGEAGRPALR